MFSKNFSKFQNQFNTARLTFLEVLSEHVSLLPRKLQRLPVAHRLNCNNLLWSSKVFYDFTPMCVSCYMFCYNSTCNLGSVKLAQMMFIHYNYVFMDLWCSNLILITYKTLLHLFLAKQNFSFNFFSFFFF